MRTRGDGELPLFSDSNNVQFFLTSVLKEAWSRLLRKARGRIIMLQRVQADTDVLVRFLNDVLTNVGAIVADPEEPDVDYWFCICCHRTLTSFQAVRRHESGSHKIQHVANL